MSLSSIEEALPEVNYNNYFLIELGVCLAQALIENHMKYVLNAASYVVGLSGNKRNSRLAVPFGNAKLKGLVVG